MILRSTNATGYAARAPRGGFTLLEILLASLLAVLVLAAVYTLLSVTLQQTQATRDAVEVEDVSRGIFNKITIDVSGTLAPLPPKSGGNSAGSSGTTASPSTSSTPTSGAGTPTSSGTPTSGSTPAYGGTPTSGGSSTPSAPTTTTTTTDPSSDPNAGGATDNSTASAADYAFQAGLIGEEKKLVIYAGRVPEALSRYGNPGEQILSDQRQIIYWLGSNGGLYRRERPWVTADGVRNAIENDEEATDSTLLAEEVVDLLFEYSDGSSWSTTWDGTEPGPDTVTPKGAPRAIRVTLTLQIPVSRGEPVTKQVSQIIAIRSAPGPYTPPQLSATTDGATDGTTDPATTPMNPSSPSSPSTPSTPMNPSSPSSPSAPSGGSPSGSPSGKGSTTPSIPSGGNKGGGNSGGNSGGSSKGGGR